MNSKIISWFVVMFLLLIPFGYTALIYPSLPDTIPIHFNANGEADGWGAKQNIFLLPSILGVVGVFVFLLLSNIHKIDPKRYPDRESPVYRQFGYLLVAFLSGISLIILYATSNRYVPVNKLIFSFLGIAFSGMGFYMSRLKQNYFAGFRLPWTLENEENWNATHQLASKIWVAGGMLQLLSGLFFDKKVLFILFMSLTVLMVLIPSLFSYRMFKRGNR